MRTILFIFLAIIGFPLFGQNTPQVLVSVPVYKQFIQEIAGDTVQVQLMVPVGASAHTYEPSPRQMTQASKADLWFITGETFETKAVKAIQSYNRNFKSVDLRANLALIKDGESQCTHCKCHPDGLDLHFWLSPRLAKIQVQTITKALQERYPAYSSMYQNNSLKVQEKLDALNKDMTALLGDGSTKRLIVVAHPAYAYMERDYGIIQKSIEIEGKEPSPRQMTELIRNARTSGVKIIYTEPQYPSKGAKLIAQEIGGTVVELDPYSEYYFEMMRKTAQSFSSAPIIKQAAK